MPVAIYAIEVKRELDNLEEWEIFWENKKTMTNGTWLLCSLLVVGVGFLIQQTIETLINTSLILLPFNIKTIH